jgi:hypothetical protein
MVSGGSLGATTNCPSCGDANPESNLFCESCGLDFVTGQMPAPPVVAPPPAGIDPSGNPAADPTLSPVDPIDPGTDLGWAITISVDTDWFAVKGEGIGTPPNRPDRVQDLRHSPLVVGRTRSSGKSPGIVVDDDHGISRRHAELTHDPSSNAWTVTDLGSTNGTYVVPEGVDLATSLVQITANTPTPITPTDRVFVGAWTRLVLSVSGSAAGAATATATATTIVTAAGADPAP